MHILSDQHISLSKTMLHQESFEFLNIASNKKHQNKFFTNDLIFETVADLLQVKSASFDVENSLLNSRYKYTADTLTTNLGKSKLSEDKEARKDI